MTAVADVQAGTVHATVEIDEECPKCLRKTTEVVH